MLKIKKIIKSNNNPNNKIVLSGYFNHNNPPLTEKRIYRCRTVNTKQNNNIVSKTPISVKTIKKKNRDKS